MGLERIPIQPFGFAKDLAVLVREHLGGLVQFLGVQVLGNFVELGQLGKLGHLAQFVVEVLALGLVHLGVLGHLAIFRFWRRSPP